MTNEIEEQTLSAFKKDLQVTKGIVVDSRGTTKFPNGVTATPFEVLAMVLSAGIARKDGLQGLSKEFLLDPGRTITDVRERQFRQLIR